MPSLPPLSSSPPAGLQARAYRIEPGSLQDRRRSPLGTSQMTTSPLPLLPPLLASLVPSGLQATLITIPLCPPTEARSRPSAASRTHTLPSTPQLATRRPSRIH